MPPNGGIMTHKICDDFKWRFFKRPFPSPKLDDSIFQNTASSSCITYFRPKLGTIFLS